MKTLYFAFLIFVAAGIALVSCAVETETTELRKTIEEMNAIYTEACRASDAAAVAAIYADDATLMPAAHKLIKGRQDIEEYFRGAFESGPLDLKLEILSVTRHGDLAYEIGKVTVMVGIEEDRQLEWVGKYLSVWKHRADGTWKMAVDISNSDI